jgi:hypothetical protein
LSGTGGQARLRQIAFLSGFAKLSGFCRRLRIVAAIARHIGRVHRHDLPGLFHRAGGLDGVCMRNALKGQREAQKKADECTHFYSLAAACI